MKPFNLEEAKKKGVKSIPFEFGEWVLVDGVISAQYIHQASENYHTVDINGIWKEFTLDRLKKDCTYTTLNLKHTNL